MCPRDAANRSARVRRPPSRTTLGLASRPDDPDDARSSRRIAGRIDDDETAGRPVGAVVVDQQQLRAPERHPTDLIEFERDRRLIAVEAVDIEAVLDMLDHHADRASAVFQ